MFAHVCVSERLICMHVCMYVSHVCGICVFHVRVCVCLVCVYLSGKCVSACLSRQCIFENIHVAPESINTYIYCINAQISFFCYGVVSCMCVRTCHVVFRTCGCVCIRVPQLRLCVY